MKNKCSLTKNLEIVAGKRADYEELSAFHYRSSKLAAYAAIYTLRDNKIFSRGLGTGAAGVIVYTMPSPGAEMRNVATGDYFKGFGSRQDALAVINENIRCIARVIIEPRYRGLGLASMLVKETLGLLNVPIIEAMAVMGEVNPFFEKAGMTAFYGQQSPEQAQMIEVLSWAGISGRDLIDPVCAERKIEKLGSNQKRWLEREMKEFLGGYGFYKKKVDGTELARAVLKKLGGRPIYYIWFNKKVESRE